MKGLTKKQYEVLDFIQNFIHTHHFSPSYREIRDHFGFSSLGSVYKHIQALKRKECVNLDKKKGRSILPTEAMKVHQIPLNVEIPFIGSITAGMPIETFSQSKSLEVPLFLVPDPEKTYILQAKGDGLNEELIANGDLLIVEARSEVQPGETVVAVINQHDTIVKRFYFEGSYINLTSYNLHQQPIILRQQDIFIQGVIIGLIRSFRKG